MYLQEVRSSLPQMAPFPQLTNAMDNSLVEEDDVREPDVLRGNVEHVHAAVLAGVPPQLVVDPLLQVCKKNKQSFQNPEAKQ